MNHTAIATCVGLVPMDLESLVKGKATAALALKLGVTPSDIEGFIKGSASSGMTKRLGLGSANAASELAKVCGRQGAIGIVMGLLFPGNL
jgi:hypothetical protein